MTFFLKCMVVSIMYIGYFGVIGYAVYATQSWWPLIMLLLASPTVKGLDDEEDKSENE